MGQQHQLLGSQLLGKLIFIDTKKLCIILLCLHLQSVAFVYIQFRLKRMDPNYLGPILFSLHCILWVLIQRGIHIKNDD